MNLVCFLYYFLNVMYRRERSRRHSKQRTTERPRTQSTAMIF